MTVSGISRTSVFGATAIPLGLSLLAPGWIGQADGSAHYYLTRDPGETPVPFELGPSILMDMPTGRMLVVESLADIVAKSHKVIQAASALEVDADADAAFDKLMTGVRRQQRVRPLPRA